MKFNVTEQYCYLDSCGIVKMFLISGLPFTFEDEGFDPNDPQVIIQAENNPKITMEDLYRWSSFPERASCARSPKLDVGSTRGTFGHT